MKTKLIALIASFGLAGSVLAAGGAEREIIDHDFSFEGPFGSYDQLQLQRGLQVYTEVCAACHGLELVGFFELDDKGGPHLPEDQVRAFAQGWVVWDEKLRDDREAAYADYFPSSNDPNAPDLSLMAKARAGFHGPYNLGINQIVKGMGGAEYIYSLMVGFDETPECAAGIETDLHYNAAFGDGWYPEECIVYEVSTHEAVDENGEVHIVEEKHEVGRKAPGSWISMAPQLQDAGLVDYINQDESFETPEQYAADVSAFLMWAAEPNLDARKSGGLVWFIMLGLITIALWFANKLLWHPVKHPKDDDA